jgi:hypothetical protein
LITCGASGWSRDGLRSINAIALLGAGMEIQTGTHAIRLDMTLDRSLLPVNTDSNDSQASTQSVLFSAGMML